VAVGSSEAVAVGAIVGVRSWGRRIQIPAATVAVWPRGEEVATTR